MRRVLRTETPNLLENNRPFHRMLVGGIDVDYQADGRTIHDKVWRAINQFTVIDNRHAGVVLFVSDLFRRAEQTKQLLS